jgi:hypothetical protein
VSGARARRLLARDRAYLRKAQRNRALAAEEIDERIRRAIIEAAIARGTVTEDDLIRANIPREAITAARFTRCFDQARERDPAIGRVEAGA